MGRFHHQKKLLLLLLFSIGAWISLRFSTMPPAAAQGLPSRNFAVVELFTSEGCSSCPPADEVLSGFVSQNPSRSSGEVIALGFHVDYWDRLGWKDPFSSAAATRRQHAYASQFGNDQVYTPQLVVNGAIGFVGSKKTLAEKAVERALTLSPQVHLAIERAPSTSSSPKSLIVTTKLSKAPGEAMAEKYQVLLALVQKSATTNVKQGENSGLQLRHVNVVRDFDVQEAKQSSVSNQSIQNSWQFRLPVGVSVQNLELVAVAYDAQSHQAVGATRLAVQ
ncbi:hypothetical protein Spb1_02360 [Planctopirus ephydatiae]|uniref:DUF1223 domain-containing protein n=1 Tax=Planctopirus ephydatiae TaxID=2528019 RepID=A0A518GIF0_9PLAN|nr:DUF1223 domain-containing protein [Planctopirus ephydatiae]QDV28373.1 hypothetical protein Spb1_02360 [Planctopirus ephydatiae]